MIDGKCAIDWSASLGSKRGAVESRLRRGWSEKDAISKPLARRIDSSDLDRAKDILACGGVRYRDLSEHLNISVGRLWTLGRDLREQQAVK